MDNIGEISVLHDFYGKLLSDRQRLFIQLYYEENYSLAEIAQEFQISRQGVHDGVKKAEKALHELEEKLGFVRRFQEREKALSKIKKEILRLTDEYKQDAGLAEKLRAIKSDVDTLGD